MLAHFLSLLNVSVVSVVRFQLFEYWLLNIGYFVSIVSIVSVAWLLVIENWKLLFGFFSFCCFC